MKSIRFEVAASVTTAVLLLAARTSFGAIEPPAEPQGPPVPRSGKDAEPKADQEGATRKPELAKPSLQIQKVWIVIGDPQPLGNGWQGFDFVSRRTVYVETTDHAPVQHPVTDRLNLTGYFVRDGDMTGQNALGDDISIPKYIDVSKAIELQIGANKKLAGKPSEQTAPIAKALTEKPTTPETLRELFALHAVTPDDESIKSEDFAGVSRSERISDLTHRYQLDAAFWLPNQKVMTATFIGPRTTDEQELATGQMVLEFLAMTVPEFKSSDASAWMRECQEKSRPPAKYYSKRKVPGAEIAFDASSGPLTDKQGNKVSLFCLLVMGDPENAPKQFGESK